jgi:nucleoside-diphosphate-sugar epimerase
LPHLTPTIDVPGASRATKDGSHHAYPGYRRRGYVGSTLVPQLLEQGHKVRVYDSLKFGGHGLLPCCQNRFFELVKGDVCDPAGVKKALDGVDAIVHLAAIVGYPPARRSPQVAQATNVEGTRTLLERKPDQKVVYASTGSIYGRSPIYLQRRHATRPITLYGETKAPPRRWCSSAATPSPTATRRPSASATGCG